MPGPHADQPIMTAGTLLDHAAGALVLLHGRGASARDIIRLGEEIVPADWAMLAPDAAGGTWYPYSFLAPREQNEPYLTSALERVGATVERALAAGIPVEKIAVAGFSQGACLATEFVGRNTRRYGALVAFTGGLIGPLDQSLHVSGDLSGTSALLTSGDPDPHVPWSRVEESGRLLGSIGAQVTLRRYPGRPHTVTPQEVVLARQLLGEL